MGMKKRISLAKGRGNLYLLIAAAFLEKMRILNVKNYFD